MAIAVKIVPECGRTQAPTEAGDTLLHRYTGLPEQASAAADSASRVAQRAEAPPAWHRFM